MYWGSAERGHILISYPGIPLYVKGTVLALFPKCVLTRSFCAESSEATLLIIHLFLSLHIVPLSNATKQYCPISLSANFIVSCHFPAFLSIGKPNFNHGKFVNECTSHPSSPVRRFSLAWQQPIHWPPRQLIPDTLITSIIPITGDYLGPSTKLLTEVHTPFSRVLKKPSSSTRLCKHEQLLASIGAARNGTAVVTGSLCRAAPATPGPPVSTCRSGPTRVSDADCSKALTAGNATACTLKSLVGVVSRTGLWAGRLH